MLNATNDSKVSLNIQKEKCCDENNGWERLSTEHFAEWGRTKANTDEETGIQGDEDRRNGAEGTYTQATLKNFKNFVTHLIEREVLCIYDVG